MYRSQLIHCLKLAFFPVIACILLAGHASGQTSNSDDKGRGVLVTKYDQR